MSNTSFHKSTTGTPDGYGKVKLEGTFEDALGITKAALDDSLFLSAKAVLRYPIEYIEFFDNGESFGTPAITSRLKWCVPPRATCSI